jgi:Spy/CpxP family protein refolding chaperone
MKKLTLTALSTVVGTLSIAALSIAPSFAQTTKTPASTQTDPTPSTNTKTSQDRVVEELKLTKDQQTKLVKLQQTVMEKKVAVLNPTQKQQLQQALQQGKNPNLKLTADQQNQIVAIESSAITEQNKILTPEQQSKLQEMKKKNSLP